MRFLVCLLAAVAAVCADDVIPGEYAVFLRPDVQLASVTAVLGSARVEYQALSGRNLFLHLSSVSAKLAERIARSPLVQSVDPNMIVTLDDPEQTWTPAKSLEGLRRPPSTDECIIDFLVGDMHNWHLIRTSHRDLPQNPEEWLAMGHMYDGQGELADVYVLDTGIDIYHVEFADGFGGTRAHHSFLAPNLVDHGYDDVSGHGTHVAGSVGGNVLGVAKSAQLYNVKVLGNTGSGTSIGVIEGIMHSHNRANQLTNRRHIVTMSLSSGTPTPAQQTAIQNAVADKVFFTVAAGNQASDAGTRWPAGWPETITVAATDRGDMWASFSNFGPLVDIAAPGVTIWSAGATLSERCEEQAAGQCIVALSGTSMATPIVAGVAAQIVSYLDSAEWLIFYQENLRTRLQLTAARDKLWGVPDPGNTRNYLLHRNDC